MRRIFHTGLSPHEFELDLAPLLAVMVKLVPVLLISSAFVQVMMIETDLPQAVKEAIKKDENMPQANIEMLVNSHNGIKIVVQKKTGQQEVETIPLKDGQYDLATLQKTFQKVKSENPEVFHLEVAPDADVAYKDVVKMIDEARRARDKNVKFPVHDEKSNKTVMTEYMFPDVTFTNIFDG
jgi:biopolymer transport protein ExbD